MVYASCRFQPAMSVAHNKERGSRRDVPLGILVNYREGHTAYAVSRRSNDCWFGNEIPRTTSDATGSAVALTHKKGLGLHRALRVLILWNGLRSPFRPFRPFRRRHHRA